MAYASKAGRARVSSTNPEAQAVCDRCGLWYNFNDLVWQFDWRGSTLQNLRILVCKRTCLDVPQEQLRAITLPADPVPIINARTEQYTPDETDYVGVGQATIDPATGIPVPSQDRLVTLAGEPYVWQQVGPNGLPTPRGTLAPGIGLDPAAQMAFVVQSHWAEPLAILSLVANGTTIVTATCSAAHGLTTGDQIAVDGVSNPGAWGFFNAVVTSSIAFTYTTQQPIKAGSLLTGGTKVITVNVGVPLGQAGQIPQVGI
jgi:hypothetical protein